MNIKLLMISTALALTSTAVLAETQHEVFAEEIDFARQVISKQRRDLVQKNMGLSAHDEKKFWGVYNGYRDEIKPILDQQVKLVTDYADAYVNDNLTDQLAIEFAETLITLKGKKLALRKDYIDKFQKFLRPKQVARFVQIENKLDAIMNYDLARKVPLVPTQAK